MRKKWVDFTLTGPPHGSLNGVPPGAMPPVQMGLRGVHSILGYCDSFFQIFHKKKTIRAR